MVVYKIGEIVACLIIVIGLIIFLAPIFGAKPDLSKVGGSIQDVIQIGLIAMCLGYILFFGSATLEYFDEDN